MNKCRISSGIGFFIAVIGVFISNHFENKTAAVINITAAITCLIFSCLCSDKTQESKCVICKKELDECECIKIATNIAEKSPEVGE